MERRAVHTSRRKVVQVSAVVAIVSMIRSTQTVLAVVGTGLENSTCCQPQAVSPVNVTVVSNVPLLVQRLATWVPVLVLAL